MLNILAVDDQRTDLDFLSWAIAQVNPDVRLFTVCNGREAVDYLDALAGVNAYFHFAPGFSMVHPDSHPQIEEGPAANLRSFLSLLESLSRAIIVRARSECE